MTAGGRFLARLQNGRTQNYLRLVGCVRSACGVSDLEWGAMNLPAPISCLTVVPLLGAGVTLAIGAKSAKLARGVALASALLALLVALVLWHRFDSSFRSDCSLRKCMLGFRC